MRLMLAAVLAALLSGAALAETPPNPSAMEEGLVWKTKRDYFLIHLNRKYAELIKLMDAVTPRNEHIIGDLKAQHQAWLDYYPRECWLTGSLTQAEGTWPSTYAMKCEALQVDRRFRAMSAAVTCIKRGAPAQRSTEAPKCLTQLAPLTLQN